MKKQIIFFLTFALSTYNCFSMELEKEDKVITLDKGLLTVIPGKITKERYESDGWFGAEKTIYATDTRKDALVNLWNYDQCPSDGTYRRACFQPLIIQVIFQQNKSIIQSHHGIRCNTKSRKREIKEAIREKQALYYTRKEGILIYSLNKQPDPSIVTHIDRMLDDNKQQMTIPQ